MPSPDHRPSVMVIEPELGARQAIKEALQDVNQVGDSASMDELPSRSGPADPVSVMVLGPGIPLEKAVKLVAGPIQEMGAAAVLFARELSVETLRTALRAGLSDVIPVTATTLEIQEAVRRASEALNAQPTSLAVAPAEIPEVVTVVAVKPGSGGSFVAANLAVLLAQAVGEEVALVDLNFVSSDLAIMFQLQPATTVVDLARTGPHETEIVRRSVLEHASGVFLLPAPLEPSSNGEVDLDTDAVLSAVQLTFPMVVIDAPISLAKQALTAITRSDRLVLVSSLDVPSVKNLAFVYRRVTDLGLDRGKIHVVLNRANSRVGLSHDEVEKAIGTNIDIKIPSNRAVPASINQGRPLAAFSTRSSVLPPLRNLAGLILGRRISRPTKSRVRQRMGRS